MFNKRLFGMLPLIVGVIVVFSQIGCENGTTEPETQPPEPPQSITYVSEDSNGNLYTLVITEKTNRSARYITKDGDSFTLTVELFNNGVYSVALTYSGTVESAQNSGAEIAITVNGKPLTITTSGTTMTVISGTIVLDNDEEITITEQLKPVVEVDKSELQNSITEAHAAISDVLVSVNGTDIPKNEYWITRAQMDSFNSAIAAALALYNNNTGQVAVDSAVTLLQNATVSLNGQKQLGSLPRYRFTNGADIWGMSIDNSGGVYVSGRINNDFETHFTAKLNNQLELEWFNSNNGGERWACASDGVNGYIIGWGGPVVKFQPNSAIPLAVSSSSDGSGYGVTADSAGNTYFYYNDGASSLTSDLQTIRWTYTFSDFSIISSHIHKGEDGYIYLVGVDWDTRRRGFVVKLNPSNGQEMWKGFFDTVYNAQDARVAVSTNSSVMVAAGGESTFRWNSSGVKQSNLPYMQFLTVHGDSFYGHDGTFREMDFNGNVLKNHENINPNDYGSEAIVSDAYIYISMGTEIRKYSKN